MKTRAILAYLLVWHCSGANLLAYQNKNEIMALISALISSIGYYILLKEERYA